MIPPIYSPPFKFSKNKRQHLQKRTHLTNSCVTLVIADTREVHVMHTLVIFLDHETGQCLQTKQQGGWRWQADSLTAWIFFVIPCKKKSQAICVKSCSFSPNPGRNWFVVGNDRGVSSNVGGLAFLVDYIVVNPGQWMIWLKYTDKRWSLNMKKGIH